MKSKTKLTLTIAIMLTMPMLFIGCGAEVESKNMEQLYAEQGVPVKTELIESQIFSKKYEYNATISGNKESSAFTSLSEKIETINYDSKKLCSCGWG